MNKHVVPIIAALLVSTGTVAQNNCSSSMTVIAGPTYTVDAVNGPEIPIPLCDDNGVGAIHTEWYVYTPAADHSLTITTDLPQNAGGDTRFNVYRGNCGALMCVGGADDQGSNTLAAITVQVSGGLTYRIAFDDRWSNAGFDFQLSEGPPVVTAFSFNNVPITTSGYAECIVDMDGDKLDDVVATSATLVNINRQLPGGGFTTVNVTTPQADNTASWSVAAGDLDGNGKTDLLYGGGSGVTMMLANDQGNAFTEVSPGQYIFCQRTNMVDVNNDGILDVYSCHDVDANVYYLHDGSGNFEWHQGGLGETCGNYGSQWIDFDNDHDIDMHVSKCGCDPVDILYRNNGDGTYTNVAAAMGFADGHQSWSSAWGDFDNDGDMDVLIGSSSSAYHKLMRNDLGSFTNVTAGSGYDLFSGTSIEWTCHDFNNDGYVDILGGGALMLNDGDFHFTAMPTPPGNGPVGDLNNDGFLDVLNGNNIKMNSGNTNKYIKVNLLGTVSNRNGIGARVEVTTAMGTQIRDVKSGDGFSFMSSLTAHFGLGTDTQIEHVRIYWPSGIIDLVEAPAINSTFEVEEGSFNVGVIGATKDEFTVFPNPAQNVLYVRSDVEVNNNAVRIMDVSGKHVLMGTLRNDQIDISSLTTGTYLLEVEDHGRLLRQNFVKY